MPGTTSTAHTSFSHDQFTKLMQPNGKGGGDMSITHAPSESYQASNVKT